MLAFDADGNLQNQSDSAQSVLDHLNGAEKISTDPIHLVDETYPRHVVFIGLAPHCFGLRLYAGDTVKYRHCAIQNTQGPLDLDGKVNMPRCVDDVNAVIAPKTCCRGGGDGDAALLFLLHPIHRGAAIMDLAHFVGFSGVIQDPFGRRGFAGVNVRHDADITKPAKGCLACH